MERRETGGFIVDAYLSNDIDDYIYCKSSNLISQNSNWR